MRYFFLILLLIVFGTAQAERNPIKERTETQLPCHPDYAALMALYNSTNGANWVNNDGWVDGAAGTDCDVCSWDGITCDAASRVSHIALNSNNMVGNLPPEIGDLTELLHFVAGGSGLTGTIPSEITQLANLELFWVCCNNLTGTLPDLTDLVSLTSLSVIDNNLTGTFPEELTLKTEMVGIYLQGNNFSGPVPDLSALTALEILALGRNSFSGPLPTLGSMPQLSDLNLSENDFSGPPPAAYNPGNFPQLRFLQLNDNDLTGELPEDWSGFSGLEILKLENNQFSGCYPESWSVFCSQIVLSSRRNFSGNAGLPDGGSNSWYVDNVCNGTIYCEPPPCHPDYDALMALYNSTNGADWVNNDGWAAGAAGTDCDVCSWDGITCDADSRVSHIALNSNNMVGNLPPEIGDLTELLHFVAGGSGLTGTIPSEITQLANLELFWVCCNDLTGTLPDLTDLVSLTSLSVLDNDLTGTFPEELMLKTDMVSIYLRGNNFSGLVPDLSALTALEILALGQNNFSGPLPTLGSMPQLSDLNLSENNFSGPPPAAYNPGNFPQLRFLQLHDNNLTGELPEDWSGFSSLEILKLENNQFSGCYPESWSVFCSQIVLSSRRDFSGNAGLPDGGSNSWYVDNVCSGTTYCEPPPCPENLTINSFFDLLNFQIDYPDCTELPGNLTVDGSHSNASLLNQLTRVEGNIIFRNGSSESLRGLDNVTYCGSLSIEDWPNLNTFGDSGPGVPLPLDSVSGSLELKNVPNVDDLGFLSNLTYAESTWMEATGLSSLEPLRPVTGLNSLTAIGNDALTVLFDDVITGQAPFSLSTLVVTDNPLLTSLAGLPQTAPISVVFINDNDLLANCSIPSVCASFGQPVGTISISGNTGDCLDEAAVETVCTVLPVSWLSFTAIVRQKTVDLRWATADEADNAGYTVQRSSDGRRWNNLDDLAPLPAGSNGIHHYAWTDATPPAGNLLYRIRQTNLDGSVDFSPLASARLADEGLRILPNPTVGSFQLSGAKAQTVQLLTANGRLLRTFYHAGARTQVQSEGLKSGVYLLRCMASGEVARLVVQK